jgi:hypothetical protein
MGNAGSEPEPAKPTRRMRHKKVDATKKAEVESKFG